MSSHDHWFTSMASRPWIVATDGKCHAAGTASAAYQLCSLERDDRALAFGDAIFAGEERRSGHHAKAHALQLVKRSLVALIGQNHTRTHRHEVTTRRPLLALLKRAPIAAAEYGLEWHVAFGECGE